MTPLLSIRNLHFSRHPAKPILSGINLEIHAGEMVGLCGCNGSGKSTLLSCITGLLPIAAGEIKLLGKTVSTEKDFRELRRRVGYALQNPLDQLIFPEVLEDVAFGPRNIGLDAPLDRAKEVLARLHIEHLAHADPWQLSGGQTRLVALAGILAMEPTVLLLDEPLAGLDAEAAENMVQIIQNLPCGKLLVFHSGNSSLCSRCYLLKDGRMEELRCPAQK